MTLPKPYIPPSPDEFTGTPSQRQAQADAAAKYGLTAEEYLAALMKGAEGVRAASKYKEKYGITPEFEYQIGLDVIEAGYAEGLTAREINELARQAKALQIPREEIPTFVKTGGEYPTPVPFAPPAAPAVPAPPTAPTAPAAPAAEPFPEISADLISTLNEISSACASGLIPQFDVLTVSQAAELGITLEKDWSIQWVPLDGAERMGIALVDPNGWKITQDGTYISPSGETYWPGDVLAAAPVEAAPVTLAETLAQIGEVLRDQVAPGETGTFTAEEAAEFGVTLEAGWTLQVTGVAGRPADVVLIDPSGWGMTSTGEMVTPAGERYTQEDIQAWQEFEELMLKVFYPVPEDFTGDPWWLRDPAWREEATTNMIELFQERPESFAKEIYRIGKTPEVQRLLEMMGTTYENVLKPITPMSLPEKFVRGTWLPDQLEDYWRAVGIGLGQLGMTAGATGEWIGQKVGWEGLANISNKLTGYGMEAMWELGGEQPYGERSNTFEYYTRMFLANVPTLLALLIPSLATAGGAGAVISAAGGGRFLILGGQVITSAAAGTLIEGGMEAGGVYTEAVGRGLSAEEAAAAADTVFGHNIALLSATNTVQFGAALLTRGTGSTFVRIIKSVGLIAGEMAGEAGEEAAQDIFSRIALGDRVAWDEAMMDQAIVGALSGGIFTGAVNIFGRIQNRTLEGMTPEQRVQFDKDVQVELAAGLPEGEAQMQAFDNFAETPEGEALIRKVAQEEYEADLSAAEGNLAKAQEAIHVEQTSKWRQALTEALERVEAIEAEWVGKNYLGPTKEQQSRIDAVITDVAEKYRVPEHTLRRHTLWEAVPGKPVTRGALTDAEIDSLVSEVSRRPKPAAEAAVARVVPEAEAFAPVAMDLPALRLLGREKGYRITKLAKRVSGAPQAKFRVSGITDATKGTVAYARSEKEIQSFLETGSLTPPLPTAMPAGVIPEPTLAELADNLAIDGKPTLTPKQVEHTLAVFSRYINHPSMRTAWELTQELRAETRAQRAESLKVRSQELIIEQGLPAEESMNQAIRETLSGELPRAPEVYMADLTGLMREALFSRVYHTLRNEPFEMASTVTALTNALLGKPIPREPGIAGGSAFSRLQRVFSPELFRAIERSASEGKSLATIIEGIYEGIGAPPIPLDPDSVNYLRSLSDIGAKRLSLFDVRLKHPLVSDLNSPQELQLARRTMELNEALAKKEIDEDTYRAELSRAQEEAHPKIPAPKFDPDIQDAFEKVPPMRAGEKQMVVRTLKQVGLVAIDIGNLLRANIASVDMSFWRQAKVIASGHPIAFYHANIEAWQALFSQKHAEAHWERITRDPRFELYERIRMETGADPLRIMQAPKGTAQWRAAEEFGYMTEERLIPRFTARIPWVKWSARAFVTGLNSLVWDVWNGIYNACLRDAEKIASGEKKLLEGEAFDIYQEMAGIQTALADMGQRASLGKASGLAPALGSMFFALRSKLGRFLAPRHLVSSNVRVRKEAWRDFSLWIGITTGLLLLGEWLDLWDVEKDPRNAEFMSIRIGTLRIDPWAGNRQFVVLYARLITGTGISSVTGAEYEGNPIRAMETFFRTSLAPLPSILLDFWTGKNFLGQEVDVANPRQWVERLVPFSIQDIWEAFEGSWKYAAIAVLPAIFGEGVQTYTGDWEENWKQVGLPKYLENTGYGLYEPRYDTQDFWADTASQFRGVDPSTLTESRGYPPYIRAIAEAYNVILPHLKTLPNRKLISINADPELGMTFIDYYRMWREREEIVASGDEEALKAFDSDERTRNAFLGNFSQREYALLVEYHSITDKQKQAEFLKNHPEIGLDPRDEWLRTHPVENAKLAIWGQAKILTMEAYNEVQKLMTELDIPEAGMPEFALPPRGSIENYFKYNDIVAKYGANSAEAKLLMTEDDALRVWLTREPITTPVESLEISVKWRELDSLYASYSDRDSPNYLTTDTEREAARQQLLEQNPEYAEDRQRRDAYNIGFPTELMEDYVEWYITDWAALNQGHLTPNWEDEWFLMEHPEFYEEMIKFDTLKPRDFSKVPTRKVASLYDKYLHLETGNPRLECRCKNADLDAWLVSAQGYTPAFGTDRCARFAGAVEGEFPPERKVGVLIEPIRPEPKIQPPPPEEEEWAPKEENVRTIMDEFGWSRKDAILALSYSSYKIPFMPVQSEEDVIQFIADREESPEDALAELQNYLAATQGQMREVALLKKHGIPEKVGTVLVRFADKLLSWLPISWLPISGKTQEEIEGEMEPYFMSPWDVKAEDLPPGDIKLILWSCEGIAKCPAYAGGCYGGEQPFISIPYDVPWEEWKPFSGFPLHIMQVMVHEIKNAIFDKLIRLGFEVVNTYPTEDGEWINLGDYPSFAEGYKAVLMQLTPEMKDALGDLTIGVKIYGEGHDLLKNSLEAAVDFIERHSGLKISIAW